MTMIADMPMAAFDIESTGVNAYADRIVTASVVHIDGAKVTDHEWLLSPGIEIPQGAIDVHGISNERAQSEGQDYATGYAEIRDALDHVWKSGRIVAGMNLAYDYSMMHYEGLRLGYPEFVPGPTIDVLVIDKHLDRYRRGGRTLTDLAAAYRVPQDDAHQSTGDCLTAARIAYKMLRRAELQAVDDPGTLMRLQTGWRAQQQDSLRAFWQGRGDDRWREVSSDWPVQTPREGAL